MDRTPADAFTHLIEDAFGALPIPARSTLVVDNNCQLEDAHELAREFAGHHWRDLAPERLQYHKDGLRWLSATGFQFYLPAYLRAAFPDPQSPWYYPGDIEDWTLWALAPRSPAEEDRESFRRRIALFTVLQREVVRVYLRQVQVVTPDSSALLGVIRRGRWGVEP